MIQDFMRGILFRTRSCVSSLFHGRENRTIGGAALVIAIFGVISRLLGFLRDRFLAGTFGAGDVLDAYYAAFRIPDFLYGLLVLGAISAAFVPIFTEIREKNGEKDAWKLTNNVFFLLIFSLGIFSLVAAIFSGPLMNILVSGFSPEKKEMTATLTRIMLLGPIFLGMSAVFGSVLVSFRNFIVFSLAPIFYNVGIIFGAVFLSKFFGPSGLAMGVVLGSMLHFFIQYPTVRKSGFSFSVNFSSIFDHHVLRVLRLMIPRSLGVAVGQVGFLVITLFASKLASGTLAAFTLANNIQSVPLGIFGIAFSLAAFPTLSAFAAKNEWGRFSETLLKTSKQIIFFVIPISVLVIALRAQIVRIILGTGEFDWEDTQMTFEILGILSVSLLAQSLIPLFARAFFSLQDTKTPLFIAIFSEAIHIVVLALFVGSWGSSALAASFTVASIANFLLLYFFLRGRVKVWNDSSFFLSVFKVSLASIVALIAAQVGKFFFGLGNVELDTFVEVFLEFIVSGFLGISAFVVAAWALRIEELESVRCFVISRFLKQPEVLKESEEEARQPLM